METEKKILTPYEVADILEVNLKSVYKAMKSGSLPHVKVGDRYLIPVVAFNRWLECGQAKTGAC